MPEPEIDDRLDARGLTCPLPVLKAQKRLKGMTPGTVLEVLADDPRSPGDFEQFAEVSGHTLLELHQLPGHVRVVLRRRDP